MHREGLKRHERLDTSIPSISATGNHCTVETHMHLQRYRAVWLAASLALFVVPAWAVYWPVKGLLTASSPSIRLLESGKDVDRVKKEWVQRMSDVSDRMAAVYGISIPTLLITKQDGPNAFVTLDNDKLPILVMNTDMLKLVGDDDDLMAAVIGHEIGHLHGEHLTKGRNKAAVAKFIGVLAGLFVDFSQAKKGVDTGGLGVQLGSVGADLVNAKFSRDQEREADDLGITQMARAGFNPAAAPRLWELMETQGGGGSGLWMSSHPSNGERHDILTASAQSLQATYLASLREVGTPVASTTTPPINGTGNWTNVGENSYSYRLIDKGSIQQTDAGVAYLVEYKYKNGNVKGFQRTAVADCSSKRRFEATQESDWATRPFNDVIAGTLNAQELDLACQMASQKLQITPTVQTATVEDSSRDWRTAAETPQTLRQVDAKTLKITGSEVAYQVKYSYRPAVSKPVEKTAAVDCAEGKRFDANDPNELASRAFAPVRENSLGSQELEFVCKLAGVSRQAPATVASSTLPIRTSEQPIAPTASLQQSSSPPANVAKEESGGGTARRLRELNELKKEGLITQKEYLEKRKALISAL